MIGHEYREADPICDRIRKIATLMGSPLKIIFCGGLGTGLAAKITNNYMACTILLATAEAMAIGFRSGIDKKVLHDCIRSSTGHSWVYDNMQPVPGVVKHAPSSNNYEPTFKPPMIVKELSSAIRAGISTGINPHMARAALEIFEKSTKDPRCIVR